jgi:hypothetical protein
MIDGPSNLHSAMKLIPTIYYYEKFYLSIVFRAAHFSFRVTQNMFKRTLKYALHETTDEPWR